VFALYWPQADAHSFTPIASPQDSVTAARIPSEFAA
jgi:hypothetical protein